MHNIVGGRPPQDPKRFAPEVTSSSPDLRFTPPPPDPLSIPSPPFSPQADTDLSGELDFIEFLHAVTLCAIESAVRDQRILDRAQQKLQLLKQHRRSVHSELEAFHKQLRQAELKTVQYRKKSVQFASSGDFAEALKVLSPSPMGTADAVGGESFAKEERLHAGQSSSNRLETCVCVGLSGVALGPSFSAQESKQ